MPLTMLASQGRIATLTLARPDARNALSLDLLEELRHRLEEVGAGASAPDAPTVLVLTGAGRAFCAGMDLKAVTSDEGLRQGMALRLLTALAEVTLALRALPMVTLAKVNGAAIGGGCGLAAVCDLAVTHADARLGFPEVDLGVCPAVVAPWLVRKIGAGRARAVLLGGGVMSGREAHAAGIVDHLVETRDELDAAADAVAARLAGGGPLALRATKALLNELDGSLDAALVRRGAEISARVLESPEAQASLRAALAREPARGARAGGQIPGSPG